MGQNYYLGVYWGNRRESPGECAHRLGALLNELSRCDPAFDQWYEKGRSRVDALGRPVSADKERLKELFERGRRGGGGEGGVGGLGTRVGLWNGGSEGESIGASVSCGGSAATSEVWIPNSCVLDLPAEGPTSERLLKASSLMTIMEAVVKAFEPEWGLITSDAYQDIAPKPEPGTPLVGWITHLSASHGKVPALPEGVRVVQHGTLGSSIVITDERFTSKNPEHVRLTAEVRDALAKAGLLRRVV